MSAVIDNEDLATVASLAAHAGIASLADKAELEYIRRTQFGVQLKNGHAVIGRPVMLVRGYGGNGRLAVKWNTLDGVKFADIDGKEI